MAPLLANRGRDLGEITAHCYRAGQRCDNLHLEGYPLRAKTFAKTPLDRFRVGELSHKMSN